MKKEKNKEKKSKKRLRALPPDKPTETDHADAAKQDALLTRALQAIGGKWKLRILLALSGSESLRYGEIRGRVTGITDMMLSQSLKELCADGLIARRQFPQIPPRVEYRLTSHSADALKAAAQLCSWAEDFLPADTTDSR
ncbi:MAG: helix-turn-helix transcriptional regulator [Oscillospiraceae bacterium]|jgi:DNA-binding HxlR family transcriptional regulator|nr:helix-turn-helix transcriptional regulator [Oscillospiraceae bacterium]MDD3260561.1 helix-turn-helix domain-containing protein [Oscillospiraceae bacterium]